MRTIYLQINGRNVDNKSVSDAIQVIGLSKDKVTMLVRKEDGGTVSLPASRFAAPSRDQPQSESEGKWLLAIRFESFWAFTDFCFFAAGDSESSRRSSFSEASERIE